MYIVIYNKFGRKILLVIDTSKTDKTFVTYGYSENCAEMRTDSPPEGDTV